MLDRSARPTLPRRRWSPRLASGEVTIIEGKWAFCQGAKADGHQWRNIEPEMLALVAADSVRTR